MAGKGDKRRPTTLSHAEQLRRWLEAFPPKKKGASKPK